MAGVPDTGGGDVLTVVARLLGDHLLDRWPGGTLVADPVAAVVERLLREVHRSVSAVVGRPLPADRWLATALGSAPAGVGAAALERWCADRFAAVLSGSAAGVHKMAIAGVLHSVARPPGFGGPLPALPGYRPPASWNQGSVLRALLSLGRVGALEAATLPARMAVATAMSGTAVALPGVRSTARVGSQVHGVLQERYRKSYSPTNLVVTDRRVWRGARPAYSGVPLSEAAVGGPPALGAMYLAWLSSSWASTRRADVTDLDRAANWEIKPLLEAPVGVLQEAWYRSAYNWTAGNLEATNPALAGRFPWLVAGSTWEPSLMRLIPVRRQGGQPAAAIPFSTMALPGMILYAVVSGPMMADLGLLAARMVRLIEREVQGRLQEATAAARVVLQALARVIEEVAAWVSEHLLVLVVLVAAAGLAAALIMTAPAWGPVVLGALGAGLAGLLSAAVAGAVLLGPVGEPSPPGEPELVTLDFGGVSVRMSPAYVPRFMMGLGVVVADGVMGTVGGPAMA